MRTYKLGFLSNSIAIKCGKLTDITEILNNTLCEIKNERGLYIVLSDEVEYIYPQNTSKVIYIGKCDNFFKRITEHQNYLVGKLQATYSQIRDLWDFDKYMYMRSHGANVYFIPLTETEFKTETELESNIMFDFFKKHQAIPVGNKNRNITAFDKV